MQSWEDNTIHGFIRDGGMEWINLNQDKDKWWAVENKVLNLRAP